MITSYFKIAWRNLWYNKTFSLIKISGLSIGLSVCMLILLYTKDETSFDRFHEKQADIYRIVQAMQFGKDAANKTGVTMAPLGPSFEKEISEITAYVRTNQRAVTIKHKNDVFTEYPLVVDSNFFSVFSFPLLHGDPATALNDVHSVVLSEDFAKKYFGTSDAMGKMMQLKIDDEFKNFAVSGIAKNSPQNSTINIGILLPINHYQKSNYDEWIGGSLNTFLVINPNVNIKIVEQKMQKLYDSRTKDMIAAAKREQGISVKISLGLQPLKDVHLGTYGQDNGLEHGSSLTYSYILSSIAIFILVIACINFINLSIAQSLKRSKEIGIRKVIGGTRKQLIRQFLTESLVLSSIAFVIAIFLTSLLLPFFNEMANKKLSLSYLADYKLYIGYLLLLLATALVAGFYPSLVLSSFQPVKVLYSRQKLMSKNYFTRGLIILQFTLSVFLIIATIAIYTQLNFLYNKDLGYDSQNLVKIDMPFGKGNNILLEKFKLELANNLSIIGIAGRNAGSTMTGARIAGKDIIIDYNKIDETYFPLFNIPFKEGRNFSPDFPSDLTHSAIVNESFVLQAGWKNPVGQTVTFIDKNKTALTVVGVIRDYHFRSLKTKIAPQVFAMDTAQSFGQAWVKIKSTEVPATIADLQQSFKKISPFFPFSYAFMKDVIARNYEQEAKWKMIIGVSSILFIFVSCIGLLGLVALSIEQRAKEIGIRKVLGAAVARIVMLISKDFILLVVIAFLISIPAGYYAVHKWLQNFAYQVNISWWIFGLAGLIVIFIALLTLAVRAIRAASVNPVKSLRTE